MKEEQTKEPVVTYQQMLDAYDYVTSYLTFVGLSPTRDYPEENPGNSWPEDARKAWETVDLFYKQNPGKDF